MVCYSGVTKECKYRMMQKRSVGLRLDRNGWSIVDSKTLEDAVLNMKLTVAKKIGVRDGMDVVDVGCGQGGFTASVARVVGENGKVLAVDVTDKYLTEFFQRLERYDVKDRVTFVQADGTNLEQHIPSSFADMVVGFRLLEELERCEDMPKIVNEMVRVTNDNGKVCLVELSGEPRNKAEELYIRPHKESGDCFFKSGAVKKAMKESGLKAVSANKLDTDIWLSPDLAKQDLSHAQVWYDSKVEKTMGSLIDRYGMKYPELVVFSGRKRHA